MIKAVQTKFSFFKKSYSLTVGIAILIIIGLIALFPEVIARFNPTEIDASAMLQKPSVQHWFGTDNYGRDIFARVVYAARMDLFIGIGAMLLPFMFGTVLGLVSGYYGGKIDYVLMRILDIFMAFPYMVLAIAIVAIIGGGIKALFISMWLVGWKEYTRLVRSEVLTVKNQEYVQAAKGLGYNDRRIMFFHILPNVLSSSIVYAATDIVLCMMAGAAMGYLGLGVSVPTPEWGSIIADGKSFMGFAWWISLFPGIFLIITGLGFSLLGDGLSDLFRTKGR